MIITRNGHTIRTADSTGGKAGKGKNRTSTIQVLRGSFLVKQFRYTPTLPGSFNNVLIKAEKFAQTQPKVGS